MSILDDDEKIEDSIGHSIIKKYIWNFIKKYMTSNNSENCTYYDPTNIIKNGLLILKWIELEECEFVFENGNINNISEFDRVLSVSNNNILCRKPVEKSQYCTLSDVYHTLDDRLLVIPRCPSWPMLLSYCDKLPDYIEFFSPKDKLEIFTFKCSNEINNQIEEIKLRFYYNSNINYLDRQILNSIYANFGEYDSFDERIIEYEKKLKNKFSKHLIF